MDALPVLKPKPPKLVSEHARSCLTALVKNGFGGKISLGGGFGMAYYYEYRPTHDVDAWWEDDATNEDKQAIIQCLENTLRVFGEVRTRSWGDVSSVDMTPSNTKHVKFSFQIARRSAQIEKSLPAPWPKEMLLDSFPDLLASKMVALVERGAPRDFRDIFSLCQEGISTPKQCWMLWRQRQKLALNNVDPARARLAIQTHMTRISAHRPLDQITNINEREAAARVREWFGEEFIDAIVD
jgi:predicted nucleotidyltransferase component of viral defense system